MKKGWRNLYPGEKVGEKKYLEMLEDAQREADRQRANRVFETPAAPQRKYSYPVLNCNPGEKLGRKLYLEVINLSCYKARAEDRREAREIGSQIDAALAPYKKLRDAERAETKANLN